MLGKWIKRTEAGTPIVVFIHGVLSDSENCWRHDNGTFWPEIVAEDPILSALGVYTFSYRTGLFSGSFRLGNVVDSLKEHLRLDSVSESRRIFFVGHSMGGIVARKYIVERAAELIAREAQLGLFLVASPSLGSSYADWLAPIARIFGHAQAAALRSSQTNAWLMDLDREFMNLKESGRLPLFGKELIEDQFLFLRSIWRKQVVEPFRGAKYFGDPYKVPASDHSSIAKVENSEAIQHRLLRQFILDATDSFDRSARRSSGGDHRPETPLTGVQPLFRDNVNRFVEHYTGENGESAAFGGREKVFAVLDAWLADPGAPRRLLVTGPGGRGKSALLLRWSEATRARVPTAFVPISIRFETSGSDAFYALLASQLARIANIPLPTVSSNIATSYAEFCGDALDQSDAAGKSILIVVDGLDEAVGWEINEALLGRRRDNVRIVVSARPMIGEPEQRPGERWLERLGWKLDRDARIHELDVLDADGIAAVLESTGSRFAGPERAAIVSELRRLSEGDPLLLGYYVGDLAAASDRSAPALIAELRLREAGFGDYFRRWVERQSPIWSSGGRELPTFDATLALLANAIGPLMPEDLEALLRQLGRPPCAIEQPLREMDRFILRVDGGFIFTHPRLGEHLRKRYFRDGSLINDARRAFIGWGQRVQDALSRDPDTHVPLYLVRFFVRHLIDARMPARSVLEVTSLAWLCACEQAEGSLLGYVYQLRAAMDYARETARSGDPVHGWWLGGEIILHSIRTAATVPPRLLAACIKHGVFSANRAHIQLAYAHPEARARGLIATLDFVPEDQRSALIEEALAITETVVDHRLWLSARASAIAALPAGDHRDALEETLFDAFDSGSMIDWLNTMGAIAPAITGERVPRIIEEAVAQGGEGRWRYLYAAFEHADEDARRYAWARMRDAQEADAARETSLGISREALAVLFRFLPQHEKNTVWREALHCARAIEYGFDRSLALTGIQPSIPTALRDEFDAELLAAAEQADGTLNGYIICLGYVAAHAEGSVAAKALALAAARASKELRQESWSRLQPIANLLSGTLLDEALASALVAQSEARRDALEELASQLDADQLRKALTTLARFDDARWVCLARAAVSATLSDDRAAAAIADYLKLDREHPIHSGLKILAEYLPASAYHLVPKLDERLLLDDWSDYLARALDPANGAQSEWRQALTQSALESTLSAKSFEKMAPHVPSALAEPLLARIESSPTASGYRGSLALHAIARRLDDLHGAEERAIAQFDRYENSVLDHHWPEIALRFSPLLPAERDQRIREMAIELGLQAIDGAPETLLALLDLGANPAIAVEAFRERSVTFSASPIAAIAARLSEAPLHRFLTHVFDDGIRPEDMPADPISRDQWVKAEYFKRQIIARLSGTREDLLRVIAVQTTALAELDGEAGSEFVLAALVTSSQRFP